MNKTTFTKLDLFNNKITPIYQNQSNCDTSNIISKYKSKKNKSPSRRTPAKQKF